jgi:AmmeMemoRadiSam system protein A
MSGQLTHEEQRTLLQLARSAIEAELSELDAPRPASQTDALETFCGAFVTLTLDGELRGCIGHVAAIQPLWQSVRDNAVAAAFRDPRFPEVTPAELAAIEIEISALSPLHVVEDVDDIEVGRDGLLIECGPARGLLLPQVAARYDWDRETFLDHTCRKAGLEPGTWRSEDARIYRFSVESFSEEDLKR